MMFRGVNLRFVRADEVVEVRDAPVHAVYRPVVAQGHAVERPGPDCRALLRGENIAETFAAKGRIELFNFAFYLLLAFLPFLFLAFALFLFLLFASRLFLTFALFPFFAFALFLFLTFASRLFFAFAFGGILY